MKKDSNGFSLVVVLLLVAAVGLVVFAGVKVLGGNNTPPAERNNTQVSQQKKSDDIALKNLGISLDDVLVTNDALRNYASNGLKGFYAFGDTLGNSGKTSPNFEFSSVKPGVKVVSAIDGVVVFVRDQPNAKDASVFLQTFDGSSWMVAYDHLTNVQVRKGGTVQVGDVLGEPAMQNNGQLRFELQVNKKDGGGKELSYCPSALLDDSVRGDLHSRLSAMMQSWETVSGLDLYDISAQKPVGCLSETVQP